MKFLLYILFIFLTLTSCRKSDEKIEELIVGRWEVKDNYGLFYGNYTSPLLIQVLEFSNDGNIIHHAFGQNHGDFDYFVGAFQITDGSIKISSFPTNPNDDPDFNYTPKIKIKKINRKKMILYLSGSSGEEVEFTYLKQ